MRALLAAALIVLAAPAIAGPCIPHEQAIQRLAQQYGEHQVGIGLGASGRTVVELFVSESGTWTVLITQTNGISCISASGDNWSSQPVKIGNGT